MTIRPRRSVLYMPASNARAIDKARTLPADAVILDLEDSVAPEGKAAARQQMFEAVTTGSFGAREVIVRINGLDKDTRAKITPGRAPMLPWLMSCVAAARAFALDILDGVYNDLGNAEGFARECGEARDMGFDGKTLIHPSQIGPCNAAFSPSAEDVAQAKKIIAAFDLPENEHKGVVQLDGRMVERLHADMARRTVAIAQAIEQRRLEAERV